MSLFRSSTDLLQFIATLIRVAPGSLCPDEVILSDTEYEACCREGNSYWGPGKIIVFRRESHWKAERKYLPKLEALEKEVADLKRKLSGIT